MKAAEVPWKDFFTEWASAEDAVSRLDQALIPSPLRQGWIARTRVHEAAASANLESRYVDYESVVTFMTDAANEAPGDSLRHALDVYRASGALPYSVGGTARIDPEAIFTLHGRTRSSAGGGRPSALSEILGEDPLHDPDALVDQWLAYLASVEGLPALVSAGLALQEWHRLAPLRNGGPTGRLLVTAYLALRGRTREDVCFISPGYRGHMNEYRPDRTPGLWLNAFLAAVDRSARDGLRLFYELGLARERLLLHAGSKRSNSRMTAAVDVLLSQPAVSAGYLASQLSMTRRGATMLLDELSSRGAVVEISGREHFRVFKAA